MKQRQNYDLLDLMISMIDTKTWADAYYKPACTKGVPLGPVGKVYECMMRIEDGTNTNKNDANEYKGLGNRVHL